MCGHKDIFRCTYPQLFKLDVHVLTSLLKFAEKESIDIVKLVFTLRETFINTCLSYVSGKAFSF
jgi:hypothetical protein